MHLSDIRINIFRTLSDTPSSMDGVCVNHALGLTLGDDCIVLREKEEVVFNPFTRLQGIRKLMPGVSAEASTIVHMGIWHRQYRRLATSTQRFHDIHKRDFAPSTEKISRRLE